MDAGLTASRPASKRRKERNGGRGGRRSARGDARKGWKKERKELTILPLIMTGTIGFRRVTAAGAAKLSPRLPTSARRPAPGHPASASMGPDIRQTARAAAVEGSS